MLHSYCTLPLHFHYTSTTVPLCGSRLSPEAGSRLSSGLGSRLLPFFSEATRQPVEQPPPGTEVRLDRLGAFGRAASRTLWDLKTRGKLPGAAPPN